MDLSGPLALRTGGPDDAGLAAGAGVWDVGPWHRSSAPHYDRGYLGEDSSATPNFFIDPSWPGWAARGYDALAKHYPVANGVLSLTALPVDPAIADLVPAAADGTAATVVTAWVQALHSVNFRLPAAIEVEARMPAGSGWWPACWAMNQSVRQYPNDTGRQFEVDFAEFMAEAGARQMNFALHGHDGTGAYPGVGNAPALGLDVTADFHTYRVELTDHADFFVDGVRVQSLAFNPAWDVGEWMYPILSMGAGGYGGAIDFAANPAPALQVRALRILGPAGAVRLL